MTKFDLIIIIKKRPVAVLQPCLIKQKHNLQVDKHFISDIGGFRKNLGD